ncbi:MAG: tRNA (adenosine(37)-N6)-threonylcarbamoyltransferase complex ATPase subunit type 1 TsaE [Zetaproteobacteria bacterium]|nr:MAG: tRNA (adenosine(37)-N6)-threonylcarbamoyltransferase complex ATPase subunit type 1 TsaE [Zetaproteobacteria bacterium]
MRRYLNSEAETVDFASEFAKRIKPGMVCALHGDLGAGKSVFARALMRALGVRDVAMPSPTFAIIQEYEGRNCRIAHMDWYRLSDPDELEAIGVREYMQPPWVCLIEWPERGAELLPPDTVHIHLHCTDVHHPERRRIEID